MSDEILEVIFGQILVISALVCFASFIAWFVPGTPWWLGPLITATSGLITAVSFKITEDAMMRRLDRD